jgi:hypothetical protein
MLPQRELREVSGLARGTLGRWWAINDSGNGAVLYAADESGRVRDRVSVEGIANVDWEDLAVGPCPQGRQRCLYIGDLGDNRNRRTDARILVVEEPRPGSRTVRPSAVLPVRYPERPIDAEALVYDPDTRQLLIFTKEFRGLSRVYARGLDPNDPQLRPIARLDFTGRDLGDNVVTGATLSADRRHFALRSYLSAFVWRRNPGEAWERLLARPPQIIPLAGEPQGEAIAFADDGEVFYTTSEEEPILRRYSCSGTP